MHQIKTQKTRYATAIALGAALLSGCGQAVNAIVPTGLPGQLVQSQKSKKPGNELIAAQAAIREVLAQGTPDHLVFIRQLKVVPGPTIAIYPPVKPVIFDFRAEVEYVALDDRLRQYVLTGNYSAVTRVVTIVSRQSASF